MYRTLSSAAYTITLGLMFFIFTSMWQEGKPIAGNTIAYQDSKTGNIATSSPFKTFIFGVGIVEGRGGNINIGASMNRVVDKVSVKVGDKVKKGTNLLMFENSDLQSEVIVQELAYQETQANLKKSKLLPRPEDLVEAQTNLKSAELDVQQAQVQFEMVKNLKDPRALSQEESNRRSFAYQLALAKQEQAKANFEKVKAGAWTPDLDIDELKTLQAKARLMQSKSNLQRTMVRSPIDGTVLQIKIREGEVPSVDSSQFPLMVLGDTDELNLKVSINQYDVPYFKEGARAVAFFQGDHRFEFPLEFIRLEPILVGKQTLTNNIAEKIDTEVLNIIYRIKPSEQKIYIGQQMDVHIEAEYLPQTPQL